MIEFKRVNPEDVDNPDPGGDVLFLDPNGVYYTKDENGVTSLVGNNFAGIEYVGSVGLVDTYRILFVDGDFFEYTVTNGADGSGGGTAGVASFNGRTGPVEPEAGDYDAFYLTPAEADLAYAGIAHTHTSAAITDFTEAAQDATGAMVTGNTEDGISVTYDDVGNKLNFSNTDKGSAAVAAHILEADPHSQYTTDAEATTIANARAAAAVSDHVAAANPHDQYTTDAEATTIANARAAAAVSDHVALSDPHGQYKVAVLDEGTSLTTFAQSLNFTGAGVTVTNTGGAVTLNIPGGGGGGGGGYSLEQLATDTNALATTTAADGDFNVTLRPGSTPAIIKVLSTDAEVILARGDRASLNNRISSISNYAAAVAGSPVPGRFYDNNLRAGNAGAFSFSANRFQAAPFMTSSKLRIDRLGIVVATLATGVLVRAFIYSADPVTLMPKDRLFQGALELNCDTTGYKAHTLDFTFDADRVYWIGANASNTVSCRGVLTSSMISFGPVGETDISYKNAFAKTGFNTGVDLPLADPVTEADLINSGTNGPMLRMRAAAL